MFIVLLITGGTKGIGASIAAAAVREGAKVAVNYGADSASAEKLVSQLGQDKAFAVQADAGTVAGAEKMVQETVNKYGTIDTLILNAGIMAMKTVANTTEADFDKSFNLNVKGPWFTVQKALPYLKSGSRVILVSTSVIHSSTLQPPYALYGSTKGAIEHMTHAFAKDLGTKGINVNCVAPGPTGTELFYNGKTEQQIQMISNFSPFGRLGEPKDVAEVFIFLASAAGNWVSGQVIPVNGAFSWM